MCVESLSALRSRSPRANPCPFRGSVNKDIMKHHFAGLMPAFDIRGRVNEKTAAQTAVFFNP